MEQYLLDTNICIFYLKGKFNLYNKIKSVGVNNCFVSEITVAELYYGSACSNNKTENDKEVTELIKQFTIVPISTILQLFADTKSKLRKQGNLIDDFDLLIGCTALQNDMTIVSDNKKHLERIPNLKVCNWINRDK